MHTDEFTIIARENDGNDNDGNESVDNKNITSSTKA